MDTTNEEDITYEKSPIEIEEAINKMLRQVLPVEDPFEIPESILLGVFFREDVSLSYLASAGDAYDLLNKNTRVEASIFDAIAVVTCGWSAPCSPTDDMSKLVPASQRPNRVRTRVAVIAGPTGVCAIARFASNPDNVIVNEGTSGPMGEALLDFWT
jgi:hypothetical protein